MITSQQLSDFIEKAINTQTMQAMYDLLASFGSALGYDLFSYAVHFPSANQYRAKDIDMHYMRLGNPFKLNNDCYILLSNWKDEILLMYKDNNYYNYDPGLRHCWRYPQPILYEEQWLDHVLNCAPTESIIKLQIIYNWINFDLLAGFSVGIQGPQGEAASLTYSSNRVQDHPDARRRLCAALAQGLVPYVHHRAMELAKWRDFFKENLHLTPRERECLRWASEGKTAWEISEILNISERTVVAHLTNASEKLGANNRIQAVARAVAYKII
ncbi:MAG: autoinducer binding domain-containing protein [Magnetococcales bacterium]|nr:autoinducer binding domain-containing protein [Magnetococcales bacterium]